MRSLNTLNRFHAFGMHLILSAGVAALSAALVFLVWYPGVIAYASGVGAIFLMLVSIDVVLGPIITLIVFNTKKKELKRDLAMVVVFQVVALLYGLHAVCVARPVYMVFNANRFDLVNANEISEENLDAAVRKEYQSLPFCGPEVVSAKLPDDEKISREIVLAAVNGGDDVQNMPKYYRSFSEEKASVAKQSSDLGELKAYNKDRLEAVDLLIKKYDGMDVGYLPVKAKSHDVVAVVDRTSGDVLEFNDFNPWK
jgi:hypothetical protein